MRLSDIQLDAMRELANIGSGTAATALSAMLARPVAIDVPRAFALPVAEAVERAGPPDTVLTGVTVPVRGAAGRQGVAVVLMDDPTAGTLCHLLGVGPEDEIGASALCEVANVLASSYLGALAAMTGIGLEPGPPERLVDRIGAILHEALADGRDGHVALLLRSTLSVSGTECAPTLLMIPSALGLSDLLARLGVGG